jgi:hypothetical protein
MRCGGSYLGVLGSIVAVVFLTGCTTTPAPAPAPTAAPSAAPTQRQTPPDVAAVAAARLATGLALKRFTDVVGREPEITRAAGRYEEALWIDSTWAVQALVGPSAEVQGYSVTTRDPQFLPPVQPLGDSSLGVTPLDEFSGFDRADLGMGLGLTPGGSWYYSEALTPSGATDEHSIVLTASDASDVGVTEATPDIAGRLTLQFDALTSEAHGPLLEFALEPRVSDDRHHMIPTTYSVLGPALTADDLPDTFRFGPTVDDVRAVLGPN